MLKNFLTWGTYISISRGLNAIIERKSNKIRVVKLRALLSMIEKSLRNDEVIIMDEFQRPPEYFGKFFGQLLFIKSTKNGVYRTHINYVRKSQRNS